MKSNERNAIDVERLEKGKYASCIQHGSERIPRIVSDLEHPGKSCQRGEARTLERILERYHDKPSSNLRNR